MAISRQKKEQLLAQYATNLENSSALFLTDYKGLSVNTVTDLRKKLREAEGSFMVVKNTLAKKTLNEAGITALDESFTGPVGIGFSFGDPPPVAKVLVEFAKKNEMLEIKGGWLDNRVLNVDNVKSLAELPPLDVVRAQLLGTISAPATQLAGVVAGGIRQVINVVNAYAESGEN